MNKILPYFKVLFLLSCFSATPVMHAMQNVLDYIKTFKAPASPKVVDWLLLRPRTITLLSKDVVLDKYGKDAAHEIPMSATSFFMSLTAGEALLPGLIPYLLNSYFTGYTMLIDKVAKVGNIGLMKSLNTTYNIHRDNDEALRTAASNGQLEMVKYLLSTGANINAQSPQGWTALILAAMYLHPEIVNVLIDAGADVTLRSHGRDAEKWAQIQQTDTFLKVANKRAIQKIFDAHKKKWSQQAQHAIETLSEVPNEYRGAKDIADIIKGYL